MKKAILVAIFLTFGLNSALAYEGYNNNKMIIIPNKHKKKNCDYGEQCNNLLSNSDIMIIIDEPANNGFRKNYNRKNYQRDFRQNNVYDPRAGQDYQNYQNYNDGYNDGYNDAYNDYNRQNDVRPQIGIRVR